MVAAPAQAANRTALVIGNSNYASSPLANPVNDATDISRVLKQLGFSLILKTDASKRDMVDALRDFGRQLSRSDIGLFYYAGHGMQIRGVNYLIPVNTNIREEVEVEFEAFDANWILAAMERAGNKLNIVILDACRDNPFKRSFRTSQTGLDVMQKTSRKQVPWVSTTPFPDFFLAGGVPGDQNLMPAQPQLAAQSVQSIPPPNVTPQSDAGSYEIIFWESIKDSANADAFTAYLEQYPDGAFAPLARIKLQQSASEKETAVPRPVSKEIVPTQLAPIDPEERDPDIVATDGHYIKYKNGIVYDTKTGLDWAVSSQANLNDGFAKRWVAELDIDGGGWRMPLEDELKSLYQKGAGKRNMTGLLEAKAWHFFQGF